MKIEFIVMLTYILVVCSATIWIKVEQTRKNIFVFEEVKVTIKFKNLILKIALTINFPLHIVTDDSLFRISTEAYNGVESVF